jgi:pimeloyl-ACP methyl ester carboxylesterase
MKILRILGVALLMAVAGFGVMWAVGSIVARPVNRVVAPPEPPARIVQLVADDGVELTGSYWPGSRPDGPAVLLLHGIDADRGMFVDNARWLNGLGYAVLAIDFRGHGASQAAERTFGWREAEDAAAAFRFLRAQAPERRIGIVGVSMGGAAALLGRGGPLPADALVLHAVYPDLRKAIANRLGRSPMPGLAAIGEPLISYQSWFRYGVAPDLIAPRAALRRFRGEVLVIGGTADIDTTVADTRMLHAAAREPKSLWLVEGADHVAVSKLRSSAYRERLRRLFAETLGHPTGDRRRKPVV